LSSSPLVVDASVAVHLAAAERAPSWIRDHSLFAPALMWSEVLSTLREAAWRGAMSASQARAALVRLELLPITPRGDVNLRERAWETAESLGWAKTYDAEYVALASLLDARLVTIDERLRRSAGRLVRIIGPTEL
jgi:predicted nucleic acid-binding protein